MQVKNQMFRGFISCVRCGYPETSENIDFDELDYARLVGHQNRNEDIMGCS